MTATMQTFMKIPRLGRKLTNLIFLEL